jgi:hypothetical protein
MKSGNLTSHSFPTIVAKEVGVVEAVILQHIYFWYVENMRNKRNYYDGKYWTYNSYSSFQEVFYYLSKPQIKRIIHKLEIDGFIKSGNYNKLSIDRTKWYTMTDKCLRLFSGESLTNSRTDEIGKPTDEIGKPTDEIGKPLPNINTNINTDIREDARNKISSDTSTQKENFNNSISDKKGKEKSSAKKEKSAWRKLIESGAKIKDLTKEVEDRKEFIIEGEAITGNEFIYLQTAVAFWELFLHVQTKHGIPTNNLMKANVKWIDEVRKLYEIDGYTRAHLLQVFNTIKNNDFWQQNAQSVLAFRQKNKSGTMKIENILRDKISKPKVVSKQDTIDEVKQLLKERHS